VRVVSRPGSIATTLRVVARVRAHVRRSASALSGSARERGCCADSIESCSAASVVPVEASSASAASCEIHAPSSPLLM
jgi:hypothetical protein